MYHGIVPYYELDTFLEGYFVKIVQPFLLLLIFLWGDDPLQCLVGREYKKIDVFNW